MGVRIADLPEITPTRVLELKREAKETAQQSRQAHHRVLLAIAEREGFPSWERLLAKAGGKEAVRAAKPVTEHDLRRAERKARYGGEE